MEMSEKQKSRQEEHPYIGHVLQDWKWITSKEAEKAYTYLPSHYYYPGTDEIIETPMDDMQLIVKVFDTNSRWTWFVSALMYEQPHIAFGYVNSGIDPMFDEFGSFSLMELIETRTGPFKLPLERDIHWKPVSFKEAMDEHLIKHKGEY